MSEEIEYFNVKIDALTAIMVIAQIQLASRHPENTGVSRTLAITFARKLQEAVVKLHPEHKTILEEGWDPRFDIKE